MTPGEQELAEDEAPRITKYQQIYSDLSRGILKGKHSRGAKLPTQAELVKHYGASRPTVARALKRLEVQGLVRCLAGSGTYVVGLDPRVTPELGILIPEIGQIEFFEAVCSGMADSNRGRAKLLWGTPGLVGAMNEQKEKIAMRLCRHFIALRVQGVFYAPMEFSPMRHEVNEEIVSELSAAGIGIVLLDRCYKPYPHRSSFDRIGIDNCRAGFVITEHLIQLGARRIAFIGLPNSAQTVDERIAGYLQALNHYGCEMAARFVVLADPGETAVVRDLMSNAAPEAIVCGNDMTAAKLMRSLNELGLAVPRDVWITGIGDVQYASLLNPPLTTIRQPSGALGEAAVNAMLERLQHPEMPARDILLDFELVVRQSCGSKA